MSKASVITSICLVLVFTLFGFIVYTWFSPKPFKIWTSDDFSNLNFAEYKDYSIKTVDSKKRISFNVGMYSTDKGAKYYKLLDSDEIKEATELYAPTASLSGAMCDDYIHGFDFRDTKITSIRSRFFESYLFCEFILLPNTLFAIDSYFLNGCSKLTTIQFNSTEPPYYSSDGFLQNCFRLSRIEVPKGAEGAYKQAMPDYAELIVGVDPYVRYEDFVNSNEVYFALNVDNDTEISYTYADIDTIIDNSGLSYEISSIDLYPAVYIVPNGYRVDNPTITLDPVITYPNRKKQYFLDFLVKDKSLEISYCNETVTTTYNEEFCLIIDLFRISPNSRLFTLYEYQGETPELEPAATYDKSLILNGMLSNNDKFNNDCVLDSSFISSTSVTNDSGEVVGMNLLVRIENDCTDKYINFDLQTRDFAGYTSYTRYFSLANNDIVTSASIYSAEALCGVSSCSSLRTLEVREWEGIENTSLTPQNKLSFKSCTFENLDYLILNSTDYIICSYLENTNLANGWIVVPEEMLDVYKTDSQYGLTDYADRLITIEEVVG